MAISKHAMVKQKLQQKQQKKSFTNILWLSVKGAFLCFNLIALNLASVKKNTKQKSGPFALIHWLKYRQNSDGFNLNYNIMLILTK